MNEYIKISYDGSHCLSTSQAEAAVIVEHQILENLEKGTVANVTFEKVMISDEDIAKTCVFDGF